MGDHFIAAAKPVASADDDLTGNDQDKSVSGLANLDDRVACRVGVRLAETADALQFGGREAREHLVATGLYE